MAFPAAQQTGWGLYHWTSAEPPQFVHPADLTIAAAIQPYGRPAYHVGWDGEWMCLRYGDRQIRVLPERFKGIPHIPRFDYGTRVRTRPPRTVRHGFIRDIIWHFEKRVPMFYIQTSTSRVRNRYFEDELENDDG